MNIEIKKISAYKSEYTITRANKTKEVIILDTKTFLVHDICHYVVEKNLGFKNGFWGMLSQGYQFKELFGKENELTEELRFIEKVVGPIQSVYLKHFKRTDFNMLINHVEIDVNNKKLEECLSMIEDLLEKWKHLNIGESQNLEW